MLDRINTLVIYCSQQAWLFLLCIVVAFGALGAVFMPLGRVFAELSGGARMYDFQNALSVAQVIEQLPLYTGAARDVYFAFSFVDYFFPFFAGLFLAAIAAFSLRHLAPAAYAWVSARRLWPLLLLGTLCDWSENLLALALIAGQPADPAALASSLVLAKQAKLLFVMAAQAIGWSLLLLATLKWLGQRLGLIRQQPGAAR